MIRIPQIKNALAISASAVLLAACGSTTLVSTPIANIDTMPSKNIALTTAEKEAWGHKDLVSDTIPGMSVEKVYDELLKNKKGNKVIVAVIDSGIDVLHEDLDGVLWTNPKEIAGNGKDDDGNGYIDDVHGYNFLGESYNEQLELTRIVKNNIGDASMQAKAKADLEKQYKEALAGKTQYEQILQQVGAAHKEISAVLGKENYTKDELLKVAAKDETQQQQIAILLQMFNYEASIPALLKSVTEGVAYYTDLVNYNLNVDFDGRKIVGDNPYALDNSPYGNGNPKNRVATESHGTHVAGIIAAERNNGIGVNGVANNVAIMSLRAVPNGDEYDKDIALAIRYAVDNGAKVINGSFGKSYSPKAEWVYEALKYAADKGVLFVHAAGNDGLNLDELDNLNFPNDQIKNGPEMSNNVLRVGALSENYGGKMVAGFSNYGAINVDVFAPGDAIYSTTPNNNYEFMGGTSMAAPAVAGVAALVWSQYPNLTANQVKQIIMKSGITTNATVALPNGSGSAKFETISSSGKMVNAYNAIIMADKVANGKITLN